MKFKFTALMLAVAIAIPAMQANVKKGEQQFRTTNKVVLQTPTMKPFVMNKPIIKTGAKADVPEGYASVTLTVGDVWEDGSGYQMLLDADATAYGSIIPETGGLTASGDADASVYAEFEYKIPENADGAMTTANIVLNNSVTILIPAGTYDWCITNPTPGDRIWIASSQGNVGGRADDFQFTSGAEYVFTVYLSGQNDATDVEIVDPTAPEIPTGLTATPAATTADVAWEAGANNASWNLRYRPYVDPALQNRFWDFAVANLADQLEDWYIYDADGDGSNWGYDYTDDAETDACLTSASYSGGALTPDNWLITPEVILGGSISFDTWNYSSSYPEIFSVYVFEGDWSVENDDLIAGFVPVAENVTVTGTSSAMQHVTYDLSAYQGKGRIAIRHFGTTDMWRFYIDNVEIIVPNAAEVPEWIEVSPATNPITIEGLTPETEYEVQVQGVAADGRTTDWTASTLFTTLAEGQEETKYYITGGFNGWLTQDPPELTEEGYTFTAVDDPEGDHPLDFKLLTWGGEDWIWIGGIDENNVGCFAITEELMTSATEISLYDDGANFRLPAAGTYTVTLVREEGAKGLIEGAKIVVTKENDPITVGVNDINSKAVAGVKYYNLAGVESNKPFDGVNVMVTTYTDGTKAAAKVIK